MAEPPREPGIEQQTSMADDDDGDETDALRRAALSSVLGADEYRPPSAAVRVECAAQSHQGMVSARNEDHYLVVRLSRHQETLATSLTGDDLPPRFEEHGYALLVADGLGEGGAGSVASRVALSTLAHIALHYGRWNVRIDPATAAEIFERAEWFYAQADAAVRAQARATPHLKGMTTALTLAYSVGDDLFIAHVGHSRAYLFRDGELTRLTRDHTVAQQLSETPRPAPVERRARDLCHILTDAVGAPGAQPSVEVERFELKDNDLVLLCTNGLTDMVDDQQIAEVLALRRRPADQCATLTDLANRAGGRDNITVVLAAYRIPPSTSALTRPG
jgi:serine/threonine protein phosphatase PrpC